MRVIDKGVIIGRIIDGCETTWLFNPKKDVDYVTIRHMTIKNSNHLIITDQEHGIFENLTLMGNNIGVKFESKSYWNIAVRI